jgi:hypothetical protein
VTDRVAEHVLQPTLVDYWAGDLPSAEQDSVEEHLMACEVCSRLAARIAAVTETLREQIPPVISQQMLQKLGARGLRIVDNRMQPGERREILFPASADFLIHHLGGLDLSDAVSVGFSLRDEATGQYLIDMPDAPFDRTASTVLVACHQHYRGMPPDNVVELRVKNASGTEKITSYTILHRFEDAPG